MATFPTSAVSIPELPIISYTETVADNIILLQQSDGTKGISLAELKQGFNADLIGTIQMFTYPRDDSEYKWCNGQVLAISEYPELYAKMGELFNEDSTPSGSFKIPDLRGRFVRNSSDAGNGYIKPLGLLEEDTIQDLKGTMEVKSGKNGEDILAFPKGVFGIDENSIHSSLQLQETSPSIVNEIITFDASRVARTSSETRPKNMTLHFCIKVK